jgi:HK97 family phage major capsid protein
MKNTLVDVEQMKLVREVNNILAEARELQKRDPFTKEDSSRVDSLLQMAEFLLPQGQRAMRNFNLTIAERRAGLDPETYARVFHKYLRRGVNGLQPEEREVLNRHKTATAEYRAQGEASGPVGGFIAPDDITDQIEIALKTFSAVRRVARVMPTQVGTNLAYPNVDDTSQVGELLGENLATAEQDVTFNAPVIFKAYKYSSKLVRVSTELLQDSSVDIGELLTSLFARRIGVLENQHLTVGTGTGQPQGVMTAATLGKTGLAGQTTSVIYDDLVDLLHSVDPLYRGSPNCYWMMADPTLAAVRKLKAATGGEPILTSASQTSENRDFILGFPVVVNPAMPVMAPNAKSILFGDFSRYFVRDVLPFTVLRLSERYADQLQTGFIAFLRSDGKLVDAGTHPIKYYANAAS